MTDTSGSARRVLVGIDGSVGSATALRWAIDHADHLGAIVPVMTFTSGPFAYGFDLTPAIDGTPGEPYRSDAILRLRAFLEEHAPSLVDAGEVIEHRAGPGLVEVADGSELLVVGTRGWSARADLSIGSVGAYCARHATVPVALIPPEAPPSLGPLRVVIGFDGSAHAVSALRWAVMHLRRTARVTVVRAFTSENVVGDPLSPAPDVSEARALEQLEAGVAPEDLGGHPSVELSVLPGDPRAVLRAASDGTDVLVIGTRGHGVLDRLLLGSVASALAHHPTVPTIVVPHDHRV